VGVSIDYFRKYGNTTKHVLVFMRPGMWRLSRFPAER
jgi:hypothetical protein